SSPNFDTFDLRTSGAPRSGQPIQHARVATELPTNTRSEVRSSVIGDTPPIELPVPRIWRKDKNSVTAETSAVAVEIPATEPTRSQGQGHRLSLDVQGRTTQSGYVVGGAGESSRQTSS